MKKRQRPEASWGRMKPPCPSSSRRRRPCRGRSAGGVLRWFCRAVVQWHRPGPVAGTSCHALNSQTCLAGICGDNMSLIPILLKKGNKKPAGNF